MGFTGNKKGVRIAIVLLLVLFAAGALGWCSRSEAAEGLSIGFGIGTAGSDRCFESMAIAQELADRKWLATLSTHGEAASCRMENEPVDANFGAGIVRTTQLGKWAIGFGAGVWEHGDVVVGPKSIENDEHPRTADRPQLCAHILVRRYLFRDRVVADLLHCSTGGSTKFNRGRNVLTLGLRF
jgi:hypothetical protein